VPVRPALVEVRFRRPMPGTRAVLEAPVEIARFGLNTDADYNQVLCQLELHRPNESWPGREADAPLPTPRSQTVSILQG
jgi:hypothetical protein